MVRMVQQVQQLPGVPGVQRLLCFLGPLLLPTDPGPLWLPLLPLHPVPLDYLEVLGTLPAQGLRVLLFDLPDR